MFRGLKGDILIKSVIIPYRCSPSTGRWSWKLSLSTVSVYGNYGQTHTHTKSRGVAHMFHIYLFCKTIEDEKFLLHDSWSLNIIVFAFPINRVSFGVFISA